MYDSPFILSISITEKFIHQLESTESKKTEVYWLAPLRSHSSREVSPNFLCDYDREQTLMLGIWHNIFGEGSCYDLIFLSPGFDFLLVINGETKVL